VGKFESDLQVLPLKLSKEVPENWLILEILRVAYLRILQDTSKYNLADLINRSEEFKIVEVSSTVENRLTANEFISKYEHSSSLSLRVLFTSQFYSFHTKHFYMYKTFSIINMELYKRNSNFVKLESNELVGALIKQQEEPKLKTEQDDGLSLSSSASVHHSWQHMYSENIRINNMTSSVTNNINTEGQI
jgi:hypothetical protein